jgi:hypothetical protein
MRPTNFLDQYYIMSKQYLRIVIIWCFTILVMNSTYIAFSVFDFGDVVSIDDMSSSKKASCISIGVILHFFLLSSFCFSFSITILQFCIFYRSFKVIKFVLLKAAAFSFGIPLLIVTIVLSIDVNAYIHPNK